MARPKNVYPTYRKHKSSGTARCWVNGSWLNLGKYDSPESHREFNRIVAEFSASAGRLNRVNIVLSPDITVDEVMLGFLRHAERYYRREDGTPTTELDEIKRSVAMVRRIYGGTAASKFGPLSLEAVREQMIQAGWCRKLINKRVGRIKRMFRLAASRELIASEVYGALRLLEGLTQGRTTARESPRVTPVAEFLEFAENAGVSPTVLVGEFQHEFANVFGGSRPTGLGFLLLGNRLLVSCNPAGERPRRDDGDEVLEGAAEAFAEFDQPVAFLCVTVSRLGSLLRSMRFSALRYSTMRASWESVAAPRRAKSGFRSRIGTILRFPCVSGR